MGYSTFLYAVDLAELQSAIGSKDPKLLRRMNRVRTLHYEEQERIAAANIARVKYGLNGELYLNGELVTLERLGEALTSIGQKGAYLSFNEPHPKRYWPPAQKKIEEAATRVAISAKVSNFLQCESETDLMTRKWEDDDDEELSDKKARAELISGTFSRPDCGSAYGYALECLCHCIGTRIMEDFGNLRDLALDSPLCLRRPPVPLPEIDDFPYISHLAPKELEAEVVRLAGMDLFYPESSQIEDERKRLFKSLQDVQKAEQSVVAFCY